MTLVQPPAEMQVFIREALNEDVSTRDSHLEHIKEWLKKQPHLPDTWGNFNLFKSLFYILFCCYYYCFNINFINFRR